MDHGVMALTAVYLKNANGFLGFVEELPGVNAQGVTLDETRERLVELAGVAFDESRREAEELLAGRDVVREFLVLPIRAREPATAD